MMVNGSVSGPTFICGSGFYFDISHPDVSRFTLEDLAYGMAHEGRWAGQCRSRKTGKRVFYGDAQHCVLAARQAPPALQYKTLLHELGEFGYGDMVGPAKATAPDYRVAEKKLELALQGRLHAIPTSEEAATIKQIDKRMMATERRDLTAWNQEDYWDYVGDAQPFDFEIVPWSFEKAASEFMEVFKNCAPLEVISGKVIDYRLGRIA